MKKQLLKCTLHRLARYGFNLLVAIDQLGNALLGGYPDETISSRAGKRALLGKPFPAVFINALFFWQADHCHIAIEWDEGRTNEKYRRLTNAD